MSVHGRCPVLVGRSRETSVLSRGLDAARRGRGSTLVLAGEAGSGKSRLVRFLVDAAIGADVRVMSGRAVDSGTAAAYRPIGEAVLSATRAGIPSITPDLAPFVPALGRIVPHWRVGASEPADSGIVLGEGVLRLIHALSDGAATVLVQEDLHWADPESMDVLEYLADNLAGLPLLLVLTARPDAVAPVARLQAMAGRRSAEVVELHRLNREEVAAMAAACLDDGAAPDGIDAILTRAEGVPLHVEEILGAALESAALRRVDERWVLDRAAAQVVPSTVRNVVSERLKGFNPAERNILGMASLLDRVIDVPMLNAAVGSGPTVVDVLRRAVEVSLLDIDGEDLRFRHALMRDAVRDSLLPPERMTLAGVLASALEASHPGLPGAWCERAADLHELAGRSDSAGAHHLEAGRRARRQGALATAAQLLEKARAIAGGHQADAEEELITVHAESGNVETALAVADSLPDLLAPTPGVRAVRIRLVLAAALLDASRLAEAQHQLALARDVEARTAELAARSDSLDAYLALLLGRLDEAQQLAERALRPDHEPDSATDLEALEILGRVARTVDVRRARSYFEQQLGCADKLGIASARLRALHQLGTIGLISGPDLAPMERARDAALRSGALTTLAVTELEIASNLSGAFRIDECIETARRSAAAARRWRLPAVELSASIVEAHANGIAGRTDRMEALLRTIPADDHELQAMVWGRCRGMISLLAEDRRRACRELDVAMSHVRAAPLPTFRPFFGLWALVRTVENRDGELARTEARARTPLGASPVEALIHYADAIALGRDADRAGAEAKAASAEAAIAPCAAVFAGYHQLARRLVAEAALADGWGHPIPWLVESMHFFHRSNHRRVEQACRALLRRTGVAIPRRSGVVAVPEALRRLGVTEREHEVLLLVAEGLTSDQMAKRLVISSRTVDKHVERLLAKTGVRRRAGLRALAGTTDTQSPGLDT